MSSFIDLPEETAQRLVSRQNKAIYPDPFGLFGEGRVYLPKTYQKYAQTIEDLKVRDDDIWICSYPKSGTTWLKEMVWLMANNLNYEAAQINCFARVLYLEFDAVWSAEELKSQLKPGIINPNVTSIDIAAVLPSPRVIQTHLPWPLLSKEIRDGIKKPKIIYVARDPKDVCVSLFHHRVLTEGYHGTLDDMVEEFTTDLAMYAPYWTHLQSFWDRKDQPNTLFLTYEEMKATLPALVDKVHDFLGYGDCPLSPLDKDKLLDHLSFEKMKANPHVNMEEKIEFLAKVHGVEKKSSFIRKGKAGGWREELSPQAVERLDEWIKKNKIQGLFED